MSIKTNIYRRGYEAELQACQILKEKGAEVVRAAKSRGPVDVVAIFPDRIALVQVKYTDKPELKRFKKDILSLKNISVPDNVVKQLWIKERMKGWHYHNIEWEMP